MKTQVLDITFEFNEQEEHLHPVILEFDDELILVDCGYESTVSKLEEERNLVLPLAMLPALSLLIMTLIIWVACLL